MDLFQLCSWQQMLWEPSAEGYTSCSDGEMVTKSCSGWQTTVEAGTCAVASLKALAEPYTCMTVSPLSQFVIRDALRSVKLSSTARSSAPGSSGAALPPVDHKVPVGSFAMLCNLLHLHEHHSGSDTWDEQKYTKPEGIGH